MLRTAATAGKECQQPKSLEEREHEQDTKKATKTPAIERFLDRLGRVIYFVLWIVFHLAGYIFGLGCT